MFLIKAIYNCLTICFTGTKSENKSVKKVSIESSLDKKTIIEKVVTSSQNVYITPKTEIFMKIEKELNKKVIHPNCILSEIKRDEFNNSTIIIHFKQEHLSDIIETEYYLNCHEFFFKTGEERSGISTTTRQKRSEVENRNFYNFYENDRENIIKYGTFNINKQEFGIQALLGYGKIYFTLKPHIKDHCTFSWNDTINVQENNDIFLVANPFYGKPLDSHKLNKQSSFIWYGGDSYIEIQIHTSIKIKRDIESLHCPKSLKSDQLYENLFDILKEWNIEIHFYDDRELK